VLPILCAALVPVVVVLAMVCTSINRAEELVRLPEDVAQPSAVRESPVISVRLSQQGALTIDGKPVTGDVRAAWQRKSAAVRLLGFEPAEATVAVYAEADVPTYKVQQLIEQTQQAGFRKCVLR
jgi:biopolymer transport protein ExbD